MVGYDQEECAGSHKSHAFIGMDANNEVEEDEDEGARV
jgi:hypothetical protein